MKRTNLYKRNVVVDIILWSIGLIVFFIFQHYALKYNFMFRVGHPYFTEHQVATYLEETYALALVLEDYRIDELQLDIEMEEGEPILYMYYVTSLRDNTAIKKEIQQIDQHLMEADQISEYFHKIRFRAVYDNQIQLKTTYNVLNQSYEDLGRFALIICVITVFRLFFLIREGVYNRKRKALLNTTDFSEQTKAELEEYISIHSKDDLAYRYLFYIYLEEELYELAEEMIQKASQLNPLERDYVFDYGLLLAQVGMYKEARKRFNSIAHLWSYNYEYALMYNIGICYVCSGKQKTGRRHLKHARRICKKRKFRNDSYAQMILKEVEVALASI